MKDGLKKCLDKRNRMTKSGAAAMTLPKCLYFDQLSFLHEKSANKPTESNLCVESLDPAEDMPSSPFGSPNSSCSTDV